MEKQIMEIIAQHVGGTYEVKQKCAEEILRLFSGQSEQLKCKHEPVSLEGKYTNCKHCTTILQLKP